jgi:hypothetical protein
VDGLVEALGDDFLIRRYDRTNGDLTQVKRMASLFEGQAHHVLVRPD